MRVIIGVFIFLFVSLFYACDQSDYYGNKVEEETIHPYIELNGFVNDTAYLYSSYKDPGAYVYYKNIHDHDCNDYLPVQEVISDVNERIPGVYHIRYHATDTSGYPLSVATRTVHVIENSTTFLNGNYNVVCTCTATPRDKTGHKDSVSTGQYTVVIQSSSLRNGINLSSLEVGSEALVPDLYLEGNKIVVHYWSVDLQQTGEQSGWGIVSPSKNSFTIETTAFPYALPLSYHCKNVFTKQLIIEK